MAMNALVVDPHYQCLMAEVPQSKTAKVKIIALVAGIRRHACVFLALADYLATTSFYEDPATALWLLAFLRKNASGGEQKSAGVACACALVS
jgi:hypothetical protein